MRKGNKTTPSAYLLFPREENSTYPYTLAPLEILQVVMYCTKQAGDT